jgi:uncharacterized protein
MSLIRTTILATIALAVASALAMSTAFASQQAKAPDALDTAMYVDSINAWRAQAETGLKRDNGWLTLAGRYVMKQGESTIGTAAGSDILLPAGVGPERLGTILVEPNKVTLKLRDGIAMKKGDKEFTGERVMGTDTSTRDWVSLGRMAFHVIQRDDRFVLRLADNESDVRKSFAGRTWFDVKPTMKVAGKFVPYKTGKKIQIINVLDEASDEPSPGYVEFKLAGKTYKLDAVAEAKDKELFIILKDATATKETYGAGRFLAVEWPEAVRAKGGPVTIDFNKVYNPPCAFSAYTTCPLPPKQNILNTRLEAGEKYRSKG